MDFKELCNEINKGRFPSTVGCRFSALEVSVIKNLLDEEKKSMDDYFESSVKSRLIVSVEDPTGVLKKQIPQWLTESEFESEIADLKFHQTRVLAMEYAVKLILNGIIPATSLLNHAQEIYSFIQE